jgi:hypothetical protein
MWPATRRCRPPQSRDPKVLRGLFVLPRYIGPPRFNPAKLPLCFGTKKARHSADFGVDSSQGFDHFRRLPRSGETLGDVY